jgi:hypothetical protein
VAITKKPQGPDFKTFKPHHILNFWHEKKILLVCLKLLFGKKKQPLGV